MIPYRIELPQSRLPLANWLVLTATLSTSLALQFSLIGPEMAERFLILDRHHPLTLCGHLFLQRKLFVLAAQTIFLWVLGNAACRLLGNLRYLVLYLLAGIATGLVHLATTGQAPAGPGGIIAVLTGFVMALCPVSPVTLVHRPHSLFKQVPVWVVGLSWVVWAVFAALFKIVPPALWAQLVGVVAGFAVALSFENLGGLPAADPKHPSLLGLLRLAPHLAPAAPAAPPRPASPPEPTVPEDLADFGSLYDRPAAPKPAARAVAPEPVPEPAHEPPPLQLRVPTRLLSSGSALTLPAGPSPVSAWPDTLPPGVYYYFDGRNQHGPIDRTLFLTRLSATADTGSWWYWVEGLTDWRSVADLATAQPSRPTPPA